jgi:catechol 2,3-dioxygenase-like lactoylglutathione lyase family enzyme
MSEIVAPHGSPLYAAVIGVDDLARSLSFYRDMLGFDVVAAASADNADCRLWGLPAGARFSMTVLADRGATVGRIVLLHVPEMPRRLIRDVEGQECFGLINLNFYCDDIHVRTRTLETAGYRAWSAPIRHDMGPSVGSPTEVMIEGPDGVIVNLVELPSGPMSSRIGQMRAYVDRAGGYNRRGMTPVVTSQHGVKNLDRARCFFTEVLRAGVLIDVVLGSDDMRKFMRYPPGGKARSVFMQGNHMFGKVALNEPLNFPCIDLTSRAVPPNVGYIAQAFLVTDLTAAQLRADQVGAEPFSGPERIVIPGLGEVTSTIVRNPGSGALQQLIEA